MNKKMEGLQFIIVLLSVIFWGRQFQLLILSGVLCIILYAVFLTSRIFHPFHFVRASFHLIADLCALIIVGMLAFFWLDPQSHRIIFKTLRWLPFAYTPLIIAQYLHIEGRVPVTAIFFWQRSDLESKKTFNLSTSFIFICVFSAGAVKQYREDYWVGAALIIIAVFLFHKWTLQSVGQESKAHPTKLITLLPTITLLLITVALGYMGQRYHRLLQVQLEHHMAQWFDDYYESKRTSTAIGKIGRLKLSDDILFRVEADFLPTPLLLQTGSYHRYSAGQWFTASRKEVEVSLENKIWQLSAGGNVAGIKPPRIYKARFLQSFKLSPALLVLPLNTNLISHLPASRISIKKGGQVFAEGLQPFVEFDVSFTLHAIRQGRSRLQKSQKVDLYISEKEQSVIASVAKSLDLYRLKQVHGAQAVINKIKNHFFTRFTYSMWLQGVEGMEGIGDDDEKVLKKGELSPLAMFLLRTYSGHCEYFATATVLLLREAGISARYVVGYSMSERDNDKDNDKDKGLYVVRGRDAHAWAIAELNGVWTNVDTTPPSWFGVENGDVNRWQRFSDTLSNIFFQIQRWRYGESSNNTPVWLTVLFVLFAVLAFRILRQITIDERGGDNRRADQQHLLTQISFDWQLLENDLIAAGFEPIQGETTRRFMSRIKKEELLPLVDTYYCLHFGRGPIDDALLDDFNGQIAAARRRFKNDLSSN